MAALHNAVSHVDSNLEVDKREQNKENESTKPKTEDSSLTAISSNPLLYPSINHLAIGACDLGGESFEIGYFSNLSSASPIVRSFGALGVQRAVEAVLGKLNYTLDVIVEHPCYPVGYSEIEGSRVVWGTGKVEGRAHFEHSLNVVSSLLSRCLGKKQRKQNWTDFHCQSRRPCFMECPCCFMSLTIFLLLWIQERIESGMQTERCTMPPNSWIRWSRSIPSLGSTPDRSR